MAKTENKPDKHKQINWIIGWLVGLFVLYLVLAFVFGKLGTFTYEGLVFTKEKFGNILVYHYSYYYESSSGGLIKYNLYLRNDPRKNPVLVIGEIGLVKNNFVFISINGSELSSCEDSGIAVASLSAFLTNNEFKVKGASLDEAEAKANNILFADCKTKQDAQVVVIRKGNETSIMKEDNCYTISIGCDSFVQAVEKFEVQAILDAKARATG